MSEISEKAIKLIKDLRRDISIDIMFTPEKNAEDESLKALVDYIAELESAQRWVPVSERLPEVYRDEDGEFIPFLVCENDKDFPYRALYDGLNWGDGMFVADVTHWMPLPKPPEVK